MKRASAWCAAIAVALGLSLLPGLGASSARAEVVERVVAVVNEDAIYLSDLRQQAAPFLEQVLGAPSEAQRMAAIEQLYRQLLDRMIQDELFIQAADEMQVSVSRAEVDRAIANVRQQSGLPEDQFWEAVRGQGFTPEQYRANVQRQLLRLKVLNNRARERVNITEEQVRERYDMTVARARRESQFNASHIFLELPSGAGAAEVAAARARAQEIRDALETEEDFAAAMQEHGGGNLGLLSQGDLPEVLEEALLALDPSEISDPVRGPSGFHVFLLHGRQQAAANVPSYEDQRMRIYQEMMEEAMTQQEQLFLAELRRQAVIDIRL